MIFLELKGAVGVSNWLLPLCAKQTVVNPVAAYKLSHEKYPFQTELSMR